MSTDSCNNVIAIELAKIEEDEDQQSRRRIDLVKDSVRRQLEGQPLIMGKDAMFFDYAANEYYHK